MTADDLPRGSETVLLVQECEGVRRLCHRVLQDQGYRVVIAEAPEEALMLSLTLRDELALAILDVALPRISGFRVGAILEESSPRLRILYTSSYAWDEERSGLRFLEKPFSMAGLASKVRQVLDGPAAAAPKEKS